MGRKARHKAERPRVEPLARPAPAGVGAQPDRRALTIAAAILVIAVFAVFARVGTQDFINFDDGPYVTENDAVKRGLTAGTFRWAFTSLHGAHWHPLTSLTHVIDVELFGLNAGAHKLVNVAVHAAAAVLLLLFLVRATGEVWPSLVVAALFALHPTRVESVAWVAERKDVLSGLFWMLTLWLYAGYARTNEPRRLIGVGIALACGLLSKPSVVTLPFVLLLLDVWPFRRIDFARPLAPQIRPVIVEKIPFFLLIVPAIAMTLRAQSVAVGTVPLPGRLANAALSYVEYLKMLVWPSGLGVFYPYRLSVSTAEVLLAVIVLATITVAAIRVVRVAPFVTVGWLWYLGTMVPMIGFVQAGRQSMADRFTYLPYVGLFIAVVWGLRALAERTPAASKALPAVAGLAVIALAGAAYAQAGYWRNSETLFRRTLEVTTRNPLAHTNLGAALLTRGDAAGAAEHFRAAVAIDDRYASAHAGLGNALFALGDRDAAAEAFRRALERDPGLTPVYRKLGQIELNAGRNEEAAELLQKAYERTGDPQVRAELAAARGESGLSLEQYESAVRANPADPELRNNYAAMLARDGRDAEALEQYQAALRVQPDHYDARMNLGALLSRADRTAEAIEHFKAAAAARPDAVEPRVYLALAYANARDYRSAVQEVDAAAAADEKAANRVFTSAVRIPFKDSNLAEFRAALEAKALGG